MPLDPVLISAANALHEAIRQPGCHVRVTLTHKAHGSITSRLRDVDSSCQIDWVKTLRGVQSNPRNSILVELRNGSVIELLVEGVP